MTRLLDVTDLRVAYGAVVAVNNVSLTIDEGEIVGLIGPNGAGKSSFIDALTGAIPNRGGSVEFEGGKPQPARLALDCPPWPHAHVPVG